MFFGIMQGRLSESKKGKLHFLPKKWKIEYDRLNEVNLDYIELFTTKFKDHSPIWNENNSILKKKINQTNLKKIILCDNYVFKKSLISITYKNYFKKIIKKLSPFPNSVLLIPIENLLFEKKNYKKLLKVVNYFLINSKKKDIEISFEVQVDLKTILKFKKDLKNKLFKITFDTGNIFLINKNNKSLENYLENTKNFINHIHLKDRDALGNNVVLGTGLINFKNILKYLKKTNYNKTFTFETNRGNHYLTTAKNNLALVKKYLN
ncbi:sugar phosphate isomerase/epimerase family protein [Candidatus Pelagibacter sp. HIMB1587]|uniref:sugar phosphate isomerase/epimerase family protein n=1 Tax=Candidatus Pelagibacter sp. HIMB1587 TaxID=3413354 RepID=UPI003F835BEB